MSSIRIFFLLDVLKILFEINYSNTEILKGYYDVWRQEMRNYPKM